MTDRRTASIGISVDLRRVVTTLERRTGSLGVTVDLTPSEGVLIELNVTATQGQIVQLAGSVNKLLTVMQSQSVVLRAEFEREILVTQTQAASLTSIKVFVRSGEITQSQSLAFGQAVQLKRTIGQSVMATLARDVERLLTVTQATVAALSSQYVFTRTVTQAQTVTGAFAKGYQRIVTALQATAVARQRLVRLTRATTGNRRVDTVVSIAPAVARALRITRPTSVRLVRQIYLTRAVEQGQSATLAGVPVSLQVLAAIQTRSLALERAVALVRALVQPTTVYAPYDPTLERTLQVPTVARLEGAAELTRSIEQAQAVSLEVLDVTPYYEIVVTLTQDQAVSLSAAAGAGTAREFVVLPRDQTFAVGDRSSRFATRRRGVRFTVEVR